MRLTLFPLFFLAVIAGCGNDYADLPQMEVDFSWPDKQVVDVSPKIELDHIPDNTQQLQIEMFDLDNQHDHGGGTVNYNGSKTIEAGALQKYRGPSPFLGSPRYELSVKAVDDRGVVIAFGKGMRRYPPASE